MVDYDAERCLASHRDATVAWPGIDVPVERFAAALKHAVESGTSQDELHAADLFLATALCDSDARAVDAFERHVMNAVRPSVERTCKDDPTATDDAMQRTRVALLVANDGGAPKIAQYTGRGPLVGWVRVIAVREALQDRRKQKSGAFEAAARDDESRLDKLVDAVPATPELAILRRRHEKAFRAAVAEALRRLAPEQRTLLRFHTHDRLSIDELAPLLGVHRATAARRLEKARGDVLAETLTILCTSHGLTASEAKSLCVALADQVDISLSRALTEASP